MTLASGHDVKIGTTLFRLADDPDKSVFGIFYHGVYQHNYEKLDANRVDITGKPGTQNLRPEILLWGMDDWSSGEEDGIVNAKVFDPADPNTYDNGTINPRIQGQFTSAPARTDGSIATGLTATLESKGFLQNAGGQIWFTSGQKAGDDANNGLKAYSSTDASTWTSRTYATGAGELSGAHANHYRVSATCADAKKMYASLIDDTDSRRFIHRFNPGSNSTQFSAVDASSLEFVGMAILRQYLYGWTGSRLFQFDTTDTSGTAPSTLVYDTGAFDNADPFPTGFSGGAVATDTSVVVFFSDGAGNTILHQFKDNTGTPLLVMPQGFNAKAIGHSNGVVYIAGIQGTQAAFYFLPMSDLIVRFGGYIRYGSALTPVSVSSGPGAQVLIGMTTGEVFIFDAERDALSLLDTRSGLTGVYAVNTFKNLRLAAFNDNSNTAWRYSTWVMDSTGGAANGVATLTSAEWDFDLPMEKNKVLLGVHVRSSTLSATATVQVLYGTDGAAPTTDAGTKTSGTDNFFAITGSTSATGGTDSTGTVRFGSLRVKVIATGTSGSASPTVYAVTPRGQNWNFVETWRLVFSLEEETQAHKPGHLRGWQLRDILLAYMENRTVVTFVDGYRYPADLAERTKSYKVIIEDVTDAVTSPGNGLCRLSLRSIAP